MPEDLLRCAFYVYRSPDDAASADRRGGTGFAVSVPLEGTDQKLFYAVTARHLVDAGYRTARLNLVGGGTFEHEIPHSFWGFAKSGADLAVAPLLPGDVAVQGNAVPVETLVTKEFCAKHDVGVGDPVVMAGRLVHHDGKLFNRPVGRFGHVSVMPDEPMWNEFLKNEQTSFVVEMGSASGFSGSPVWVYKLSNPWPAQILGMDWGHLTGRTASGVTLENVGLACVVPAWEILEVINSEKHMSIRKKVAEETAKAQSRIARGGPDSQAGSA